MKKVFLMGKVRKIDNNFSAQMNNDLKEYMENKADIPFSCVETNPKEYEFTFGIKAKDGKPIIEDDLIRDIGTYIILGESSTFKPAYPMPKPCYWCAADYTYGIDDFISIYTENAKHYGADKHRKIELRYDENVGLTMKIKFA